MTLIEGVGDEVVQFVISVLLVIVGILAWWSTNAHPNRYRPVMMMRTRTNQPLAAITLRSRTNYLRATRTIRTVSSSARSSLVESRRGFSRVIPLLEMDSIIDADMAVLDNNRLHFYRNIDSTSNNTQRPVETQEQETETAVNDSAENITAVNTSENVDAENDSGNATAVVEGSENAPADNIIAERDRRKILIKLKYLNDTLKEVEGSLDELLKDFKWRHFSAELSAESRVRLIFNGRVLLEEAATLEACGLHHRAVVHCLVHPNRNNTQQRAAAEEEKCEYSNMFTASASVALFGLTVFYSVAIFGLYLSDTFHVERRNQDAPLPPN
ncbi:PREDICTED: transmembrane and ubiquitin-like domain-containing protein 1 [Papilio polytes]|uniref:transmembrane and ubiquitin-like domain-containing protein 1 n=1 Tax=Papilio polytes TaxID=76194 RepID=UPI00067677A2|nr:PREDICTED: transmembrane and ubiquitin-like domain-containing protein 1 [Papilio polytes]